MRPDFSSVHFITLKLKHRSLCILKIVRVKPLLMVRVGIVISDISCRDQSRKFDTGQSKLRGFRDEREKGRERHSHRNE